MSRELFVAILEGGRRGTRREHLLDVHDYRPIETLIPSDGIWYNVLSEYGRLGLVFDDTTRSRSNSLERAHGMATMKRSHESMMTLPVLVFMMSGGALFAQQQSDADATKARAQPGSVDKDVRFQRPATRVVESIEHSVKVVRSEPIAVQAEDSEDAQEPVDPAEETEQTAQAPLVLTPPVQAEWYSYRTAVENRSARTWSVHHNRATTFHPHSFSYQSKRYRGYTPKRDWTYHPKRFREFEPKRDWSYHRQ